LLLTLGLEFLEERQSEVEAKIDRQESLVQMYEAEHDTLARTHAKTPRLCRTSTQSRHCWLPSSRNPAPVPSPLCIASA